MRHRHWAHPTLYHSQMSYLCPPPQRHAQSEISTLLHYPGTVRYSESGYRERGTKARLCTSQIDVPESRVSLPIVDLLLIPKQDQIPQMRDLPIWL